MDETFTKGYLRAAACYLQQGRWTKVRAVCGAVGFILGLVRACNRLPGIFCSSLHLMPLAVSYFRFILFSIIFRHPFLVLLGAFDVRLGAGD